VGDRRRNFSRIPARRLWGRVLIFSVKERITSPTIQIEHHKTGAIIEHSLEEKLEDRSIVKFYKEAEAILSHLKRRSIPMIQREVEKGKSKPYSLSGMHAAGR
jgi:hypothetical protein